MWLAASVACQLLSLLVPLCRYEFRYKQSVTTSDNFLGMSGKDPSSTCCEHLVLVVQLPQAKSAAGEAYFSNSAEAPAAHVQCAAYQEAHRRLLQCLATVASAAGPSTSGSCELSSACALSVVVCRNGAGHHTNAAAPAVAPVVSDSNR